VPYNIATTELIKSNLVTSLHGASWWNAFMVTGARSGTIAGALYMNALLTTSLN